MDATPGSGGLEGKEIESFFFPLFCLSSRSLLAVGEQLGSEVPILAAELFHSRPSRSSRFVFFFLFLTRISLAPSLIPSLFLNAANQATQRSSVKNRDGPTCSILLSP